MEPNKNLLPLRWDSGKKDRPGCLQPICISLFLVKYVPELLGLQALRVFGAHDVYRYRSRDLNFIDTGGKKQQLTVPVTCDQSQLWLLPHDISMQWRISLFFRQRQMNTLSSSEAWGRRMRNSGVIWIPRLRGGVSQPQKSFSLMLTHKASLRDLSIKLQHAMQKN